MIYWQQIMYNYCEQYIYSYDHIFSNIVKFTLVSGLFIYLFIYNYALGMFA